MKLTKSQLKKIIQEEIAYVREGGENTGQGAEFELGLFITKLDKIQPGLGIELDGILKKLDVRNKQTP